jgi:methyl-accepting chemotaxis protein
VAEEVRKLAEQSARATAEIGHLIERIQSETGVTVTGMRDSVAQVEQTLSVVQASGQRLQEILQEADLVAGEVQQVSSGVEQVSSGSQEIAAATEEQSAVIQQVASASQNLSNMAQELQGIIGQFKVN